MSKLAIDQENCVRCGACVASYPDYFESKDNLFLAKEVEVDQQKTKSVSSVCPVGAIGEKKLL